MTLLFRDDFSSNDFSHAENGVTWDVSSPKCTVVSNRGNGNSNCVRFSYFYGGSGHPDNNSSPELSFDLGGLYDELTWEWDMYIPAGGEEDGNIQYDQYNADGSSSNNKLLRVWDVSDNDDDELGFSTNGSTEGGLTRGFFEWDDGSGMGNKRDPYPNGDKVYGDPLFTAADRGTWVTVKVYLKKSQLPDGSDGEAKIYRNGQLIKETSLSDINFPQSLHFR